MKIRKIFLSGVAAVAITVLLLPVMIQAGSLEPSGAPASTMKTLDEIPPTWSQILPASERFELVLGGDGVLDKETGLVWEQSPSTSTYTWVNAQDNCAILVLGNRMGWHLPTIEQLASLVDNTQPAPKLSSGHPFVNVQSANYWSATTRTNSTTDARGVNFSTGAVVNVLGKTSSFNRWCVRGGQSHDIY